MNAHTPTRSSLAWMAVAIAVTLGIQAYLWPHITDDAYITFRYALNLATGQGLVFNQGEYVEGFSNPLWTLLLALLHLLTGAEIPDAARVAGLLFAVGTLSCVFLISLKSAEPPASLPLALGALLVVLAPGFHVYATAGLEGPMLGFLLTAGLAASLGSSRSARFSAALLFGLAGITRPEGPLYAVLWFLATINPALSFPKLLRMEAGRFLLMITPIVAWQIFRLTYFGTWLPNTAIAKVPGVFGEFIDFPEYVTPWIVAAGGPLILFLWMVLPPRSERVQKIERICLAIAGANLVFVSYAQGDWMTFGRFITPVWPVMSLTLALWIAAELRQLQQSPFVRFRKALPYLPAAGIVLCAFLAWYPSVKSYVNNEGMNMLMRGTDQLAVGRWIDRNIAPGASVATGRLGGISYGAMNQVVWDWFGLTDAEEAAYIRKGRPGKLIDDPVFLRKPDVIAGVDAPADWSYKRTTQLMDFLEENYIFVMGFPQGRYGYLDIWIRKNRIRDVLVTREEFVL
ncbi:MAG: hypothetical protein WEB37_08190 [Bacteroidota bacterium]